MSSAKDMRNLLAVDQDRGPLAVLHRFGGDGMLFSLDVGHARVGVVRREVHVYLVQLGVVVGDLGRVAMFDIPTDVKAVGAMATSADIIAAKEQGVLAKAAMQVVGLMILDHIRHTIWLLLHHVAVQTVVARAANKRVVALVKADQIVVAAMAEKLVVAAITLDQVAMIATVQCVIAVPAEDLVRSGALVPTLALRVMGRRGLTVRMMGRLRLR